MLHHPHCDAIGERAIEDGLSDFIDFLDAGGMPESYPWPDTPAAEPDAPLIQAAKA